MRNLLSLFLLLLPPTSNAATSLVYSAYLRTQFNPRAISTDAAGNVYLAGDAGVDSSSLQRTALIVKLSPQADRYLYTRYLGGSVYDSANAITIDSAGNVFVVGQTDSPDFPVTPGYESGASAPGVNNRRSFLTKLDAAGNIVFSTLLGGPAQSYAQAVALTAAGQILVTGTIQSAGFPATPGVVTAPAQSGAPYLVKLDSTGKTLVFAAPGIGGNSIALDAAGNIYVAGATSRADYPTTPGAYQTTFPQNRVCTSPCSGGGYLGSNQYVTKIDPLGSRLIYSTALTGTRTSVNTGLVVDEEGNAYVTGFAGDGYPYSVTVPARIPVAVFEFGGLPFITKLDAAGRTLLFSLPIGGVGLTLGAGGSLYAGGHLGFIRLPQQFYSVPLLPPSLENIPPQCLPNIRFRSSAYATQLDSKSGSITASQFIGGETLAVSGVKLAGSKLWLAGATNGPNIPLTPRTLPGPYAIPGTAMSLGTGAYLGGVDFSPPPLPAGTPQIACVLDAADLSTVSVPSRLQLLSIFGTSLGPDVGVAAADRATELAGVQVNFGTTPATLLYVSSNQINLAVPAIPGGADSSPFEVNFNGRIAAPRELRFTYLNPHLFLNNDADANGTRSLVALNPDGSKNSTTNPARAGSIVSLFVNGLVQNPNVTNAPFRLLPRGPWRIVAVELATPFVTRIDIEVPQIGEAGASGFSCPSGNPGSLCSITLELFFDNGTPIAPIDGARMYTVR